MSLIDVDVRVWKLYSCERKKLLICSYKILEEQISIVGGALPRLANTPQSYLFFFKKPIFIGVKQYL